MVTTTTKLRGAACERANVCGNQDEGEHALKSTVDGHWHTTVDKAGLPHPICCKCGGHSGPLRETYIGADVDTADDDADGSVERLRSAEANPEVQAIVREMRSGMQPRNAKDVARAIDAKPDRVRRVLRDNPEVFEQTTARGWSVRLEVQG